MLQLCSVLGLARARGNACNDMVFNQVRCYLLSLVIRALINVASVKSLSVALEEILEFFRRRNC